MATKQSTVDDFLALAADVGRITARKMFGEYCVYLDEKPVALVCDDILYVKVTAAGRALVPEASEATPYEGAKPHIALPPESWGDGKELRELLRATFDALPKPKPRKRRS